MVRAALILVGFVLVLSSAAFALLHTLRQDGVPASGASNAVTQLPLDRPPPPQKQARATAQPQALAETKVVRQIAPQVIAAPAASDMMLVREAPRPPLSDLGQAHTRRPGDPGGGTRLYKPVALSAGRIAAQGYRIRLSGIIPTSPDTTCQDSSGGETPCGMRARTALRRFIRGRAIECEVPSRPITEEIVTDCKLAGKDIGAWLVEYGWALPDGDRYQAAALKARDNRRGLLAAGGLGIR